MKKRLTGTEQPNIANKQAIWRGSKVIPGILTIKESDPPEIQILKAITVKMRSGYGISLADEEIRKGLEKIVWPKRMKGESIPEQLANWYIEREEFDEAEEVLGYAADRLQHHSSIWNSLGNLLLSQKKYKEARSAFRCQRRADKDMRCIQDSSRAGIAETYFAEGNFGAGISILVNYKRLGITTDAKWKLGEGYLMLGRSNEALLLMTNMCTTKTSLLLNRITDWEDDMKVEENIHENHGYSTEILLDFGQINEEDLELLER